MKRQYIIIISTFFAFFTSYLSADVNPILKGVSQCKTIQNTTERLTCYDDLAAQAFMLLNEPKFAGKHTLKTDYFTVTEPLLIRFHSDGAIFVMALYDKDGTVIENLHIGGGGEDTYLLTEPGKYYLQINGSTTWKVWFDQVVDK